MDKLKIKFPSGREMLLFLFFLLVSCCLWLMLTLNRNYETDIDFIVYIRNIPENAGFVSADESKLTVRVRDNGTTLMNYSLEQFLPVTVDYSELKNERGRLTLPVKKLKKRIEGQLQSSTSLMLYQPDTLVYYTREGAHRVPVRINATLSAARQYAVDSIKVIPDSVLVFAPSSVIDTLRYVSTRFFERGELRDSAIVDVELMNIPDVACVPSEVKVVIPVTPYAEKSYELPIAAVGFPDSMRLKTFPSHATVFADVSLARYEQVKADAFEVAVVYDEIEGGAERVKLRLMRSSDAVRNVRLVPDEVEYLIDIENK